MYVQNADNHFVMTAGAIALVVNVRIWTSTTVSFKLGECLGTDAIFGWDVCGTRAKAIITLHQMVQLTDDTAVSIIKDPLERSSSLAPIQVEQKLVDPKGWVPCKISGT